MLEGKVWGTRRGLGERNLNRVGSARDRQGRRIRLKLWVLLALGEVRAGRPAVVIGDEVVDQMRREREQVDGEQPHRQTSQEPLEPVPHRCCYSN